LYLYDLRIYDPDTSTWLPISSETIISIEASRAVTEKVDTFKILLDTTLDELKAGPGDCLYLFLGLDGGDIQKWIGGWVESAKEIGSLEERFLEITGRGWSGLLKTSSPVSKSYENIAVSEIIKDALSSIEHPGTTSNVADEPVIALTLDVWIDLAHKNVDQVQATLDGQLLTPLTDFEADSEGGKIKFLSTGKVERYDKILVSYTTTRPVAWIDKKITLNNVATISDTLYYVIHNQTYWSFLKELSLVTPGRLDFYLDPDLDLHVFKRGTLGTKTVEEIDLIVFDYTEDSSYIINKTLVYGPEAPSFPEDEDAYTDFPAGTDPASKGWTAKGYSDAIFDLSTFDNAYFYDPTLHDVPVSLSTPAGQVGANCLKAEATSVLLIELKLTLASPQDLSSDTYSPLNFREFYEATTLPNAWVQVRADASNYDWKAFTPTTSWSQLQIEKPTNWTRVGSDPWSAVKEIVFRIGFTSAQNLSFYLDHLFFGAARIKAEAEDSTSQSKYGIKTSNAYYPYPAIDLSIKSPEEAQALADAIIETFKEPIPIIEKAVGIEEFDLEPGYYLKIQKEDGTYWPSTRIVEISHIITDEWITEIRCRLAEPASAAKILSELEREIKELEASDL